MILCFAEDDEDKGSSSRDGVKIFSDGRAEFFALQDRQRVENRMFSGSPSGEAITRLSFPPVRNPAPNPAQAIARPKPRGKWRN